MDIFGENTWKLLGWLVVEMALTSLKRRFEVLFKWSRKEARLKLAELIAWTGTLHFPWSAQMVLRSGYCTGTSTHWDWTTLEATNIVERLSLIWKHIPSSPQEIIFILCSVFLFKAYWLFGKLETIGWKVIKAKNWFMMVDESGYKFREMWIFLFLSIRVLKQCG